MGILSLGIILIFVGAVLLAVSSISSEALAIIGGVLLGVGLLLLLSSIFFCCYAWCMWFVRDEETQTVETVVMTVDQTDGDWVPSSALIDKRAPNGVLRDSKQLGTLTKKHVTISPRSTDSFSSGYNLSARPLDLTRSGDQSGSKGTRIKSGTSSASSDLSTLASFAYLNDPSLATPYSSFSPKRIQSSSSAQVPVQHVQSGYGSVPRNAEFGRTVQIRPYYTDQAQGHIPKSNLPPLRRRSDDEYDNTGDMTGLLPQQTFQVMAPSQWQQHNSGPSWPHHNVYVQPSQPPIQQTVWQYQTSVSQPNWRQVNPIYDEPPPPQPLVQPSQRRPMTFEQISSSKVSLYDNMQMARKNDDE